MYAKIFSQIFDSSIADDWQVRHVFEDLLTLATAEGIVDMTPEAIAARTRIPLEIVRRALSELQKPDPRSRTPDEEGKRLILLNTHRDWGWQIVNYEKYRGIKFDDERMASILGRNSDGVGRFSEMRKGYVYYASSQDGKFVKIGFSKNPWSRVKEASVWGITTLVATEKGKFSLEHQRHEEFKDLRLDGEWFKFEGKLKEHIDLLRKHSRNYVVTNQNYVDTTSASVSVSVVNSSEGGMGEGEKRNVTVALPESGVAEFPPGFPKSEQEAITYSLTVGCPPDFVKSTWNLAAGRGGADSKGQPISRWPNYLSAMWDFQRSRTGQGGNGKSASLWEMKTQLEAIEKQIEKHPANRESTFCNGNPTELERNSLRELRKKARELTEAIANGAVHA